MLDLDALLHRLTNGFPLPPEDVSALRAHLRQLESRIRDLEDDPQNRLLGLVREFVTAHAATQSRLSSIDAAVSRGVQVQVVLGEHEAARVQAEKQRIEAETLALTQRTGLRARLLTLVETFIGSRTGTALGAVLLALAAQRCDPTGQLAALVGAGK